MSIRRSFRRAIVLCTAVALMTGAVVESAGAQAPPAQTPPAQGPQAQAPQAQGTPAGVTENGESRISAAALAISEAPTIDGILDEAAWQDAPVMTGFTQAEPLEGQPASQNT